MAIPVKEFRNPEFMAKLEKHIQAYLWFVLRGKSSHTALRVVFGDDYVNNSDAQAYIDYIECSQQYMREYKVEAQKLGKDTWWSEFEAARRLVAILEDNSASHNAQIQAIKELNVIYGITFIDDKGNTRAGRNLADFYREQGKNPVTHPIPQAGEKTPTGQDIRWARAALDAQTEERDFMPLNLTTVA